MSPTLQKSSRAPGHLHHAFETHVRELVVVSA